jgi:hypothetical protein
MAGCSLATSLDGLTGGGPDASSSTTTGPGSTTTDPGSTTTEAGSTTTEAGAPDATAGECGNSCSDGGTNQVTTADAEPDALPSVVDAGDDSGCGSLCDAAPDTGAPDVGAPDVGPPPAQDAGPCTPPTPASLDVCTGFGSLADPPVIDGALDCGVPLWSMPVVVSSGPGPIPAGAQAVIGAAWRPDGLYLFVSVSGVGPDRYPAPSSEVAWCGDAIELFADHDGVFPNAPNYNDPGTIQLVAIAPATTDQVSNVGQMFRDGSVLGPWNGQFVSHSTDDGFTTEAFITASDLGLSSWSLSAGGNVGLDVAVDLGSPSDPGGCGRLGQFSIQLPVYTPTGCGAGCNVGEFCTPELE